MTLNWRSVRYRGGWRVLFGVAVILGSSSTGHAESLPGFAWGVRNGSRIAGLSTGQGRRRGRF